MTSSIRFASITFTLLLALVVSAHAQATRTWVSGVGDDANPCSRTAPCKTFAGAISKTAASGEINVLDPGGFGAVTITKSITISSEGSEAGVLVSGTNGIVVDSPGADVHLRGLDIEGLGTGLSGISLLDGAMLSIENSVIKHFTVAGINVATPSKSSVFINNTKIENNAVGVNVAATSTNLNRVLIDQGKMVGNGIGIKVTGVKSAAVLTDSVVRESLTKDLSIVSNGMVQSYGNNAIGSGSASARLLLK